jgi:hypothetical protein
MAKLQQNPTIATFRKSLNDYITAAKDGSRFTLRRYSTPLAEVGPVDQLPKEYRSKAQKVRFTMARNDFPSITKSIFKGHAIVVTKLVRGKHTLPKRGRRKFALARDESEIAAIWPLPQYAIAGHFGGRLRKVEDKLDEFLLQLKPLLQRLAESKALQEEIDEKRRIAENLANTIQRVATSVPSA